MAKNDNMKYIVGIVAVVAIFFYMSSDTSTPTTTASITLPGQAPAQLAQPNTVTVQAAPDTDVHTGIANFKLGSSTGGTGVTSKMLVLDKSEGVYDSNGVFLERDTNFKIRDTLNNLDKAGLKAPDGKTPQDVSPTTGTWAPTITGVVGDRVIIYTYQDTSAAKAENASTAKLVQLRTWSKGTDTWTVALMGTTASNAWNLINYAYYDWMDSSNTARAGIDFGNAGTAGTTQTIRWYANASVDGEACIDCALFVNAPSNFTGKFKKLTVSDKKGHSAAFTSLKLASGVSGIDVVSGDVPSPTLNYNTYFLGYMPDSLVSLRTSVDRNELTFAMETTTYSTQMNVTVYGMQNSHALSTTDSFPFVNPFEVGMSTGSTIAYWNP